MSAKTPVKIRIDIVEDASYSNAGIGKKYAVNTLVYEKKTGRTVDHGTYGTGYTWKEACAVKTRILSDYAHK